MKELLLKNRISKDKKRREYLIDEISLADGMLMHTQKRCVYAIKNEVKFRSWDDLLRWIKIEKEQNPARFKQTSVVTKSDKESKSGFFEIKVWGTIYAKMDNQIFAIDYVHSVKIDTCVQKGTFLRRNRWQR